MDLFDLGAEYQEVIRKQRERNKHKLSPNHVEELSEQSASQCSLTLPSQPYTEQPREDIEASTTTDDGSIPPDLVAGLVPMRNIPTLVLGVTSDILFPAWQQREVAEALKKAGNRRVTHVELGEDVSLFGHDSFLLDIKNIGGSVKRFLEG